MIISDLPHSERLGCLKALTPHIEEIVGMPMKKEKVFFGCPVYYSFGMNLSQASKHPKSGFLKKLGCDLESSVKKLKEDAK
jgi:hypothetical protein